MAHPIRPESYQEIGNFYTATVYEKGAEVIRMQHTLLGEAGFRAGMDEYFRRHDGQAVTCDDFVAAMESVYVRQHPGRDLSVFRRWYRQAGTPRVTVRLEHDAAAQRCTVTLSQECAPVGVEKKAGADYVKAPYHIPFAIGLLDAQGRALPLKHDGKVSDTALLELTTQSQQWTFDGIAEPPVPSLLRDFSAPVIVEYDWTDAELALLSAHDANPFARWEAGQELATRQILALAEARQAGRTLHADPAFIDAWRALLTDPAIDAAFRARALALPSEKRWPNAWPPSIPRRCRWPATSCAQNWAASWPPNSAPPSTPTRRRANTAPRLSPPASALKNLALAHLMAAGDQDAQRLAEQQYASADNMTDSMAALSALINYGQGDYPQQALAAFYDKWRDNPLVIDKWFALQATARSTTVQNARELMAHPAFTLRNPNRARALVFQFCLNNARGMHHPDGSGYAFWADQVLALDALNRRSPPAWRARAGQLVALRAGAARAHEGSIATRARAGRPVAQRAGNRIQSLEFAA